MPLKVKLLMDVKFIPGDPSKPECGELFGGWLTEYEGTTLLVDCGVGSGASSLIQRLKNELNGRSLDYVLLTHIHLDHAGALGAIFQVFPEAKAVVHENGLRHLAAPERLWAGTKQVMKEYANMYGQPLPVDPERLIPHPKAPIEGLQIIETPGHAPHHLSFSLAGLTFAGEAAGYPYYYKNKLYNRPTTPPKFLPEVTKNSIQKLLLLPDGPAYCGHYKDAVPLHKCLNIYLKQLTFWDKYLAENGVKENASESRDEYLMRLTNLLFEDDPNLSPLKLMNGVNLGVEKFFMRNSVEGFILNMEETGRIKI